MQNFNEIIKPESGAIRSTVVSPIKASIRSRYEKDGTFIVIDAEGDTNPQLAAILEKMVESIKRQVKRQDER